MKYFIYKATSIINLIKTTNKAYEDYNTNLMKKASFTLTGVKPYLYNEKDEKKLPATLLNIYRSINNKLLTISIQIENTNTLLDIVNLVFDNGLNTRVAVDSGGIAEGGVLLNEIQETVLRICKILMPPTKPAYTIKDECLGTFGLDKDREEDIKLLTESIDKYIKSIELISGDPNKFSSASTNIRNYQTLMYSQIGQMCGHIENYQSKLNNMNLEEFTTTRIKGLKKIYDNMNVNLDAIINSV